MGCRLIDCLHEPDSNRGAGMGFAYFAGHGGFALFHVVIHTYFGMVSDKFSFRQAVFQQYAYLQPASSQLHHNDDES
jgi:hypothetical protein